MIDDVFCKIVLIQSRQNWIVKSKPISLFYQFEPNDLFKHTTNQNAFSATPIDSLTISRQLHPRKSKISFWLWGSNTINSLQRKAKYVIKYSRGYRGKVALRSWSSEVGIFQVFQATRPVLQLFPQTRNVFWCFPLLVQGPTENGSYHEKEKS